jgi:hypothetical protein
MYPIELWHIYDVLLNGIPRTNNAIEGWHNVFAKSFLNSKRSFILLVERLRNEKETIQQKLIWFDLGYSALAKRKYILMETI